MYLFKNLFILSRKVTAYKRTKQMSIDKTAYENKQDDSLGKDTE